MTSPVRIRLTGRQTRLKFGTPESLSRARNHSGVAAITARPSRSLPEAILGLIRIAAAVLPRPSSNPGSVSATPPRASLPVLIRGHQPQSSVVRTVSAAFRKLCQELRGCLSYRVKSHHLGVWAVAHRSDKTTGASAWGAKTNGNRCVK